MLDRANLIPYLLQRNLISAQSIIESDLDILDVSRRNRNFVVRRERAPSYVLKQGLGAQRAASVANEAKIYELLSSDHQRNQFFRRFCTDYVAYDRDEGILVLKFVTDSRNLQAHYMRHGRFSQKIAHLLGDALGCLHRDRWAHATEAQSILQTRPWILSFHRPDISLVCDISETNLTLIKILQHYPAFFEMLEELNQGWNGDAFIHADIRWENCLVLRSGKRTALKIIDWELAGPGDPAWDVGSVFGAYLSFWLLFVPVTPASEPESFLKGARYPLHMMRPGLRAFWRSYVRQMKLDAEKSERLLVRAVKYSAARLIQSVFEQMQEAPRLFANAVSALQLSLNIFQRPEYAADVLLGLYPRAE